MNKNIGKEKVDEIFRSVVEVDTNYATKFKGSRESMDKLKLIMSNLANIFDSSSVDPTAIFPLARGDFSMDSCGLNALINEDYIKLVSGEHGEKYNWAYLDELINKNPDEVSDKQYEALQKVMAGFSETDLDNYKKNSKLPDWASERIYKYVLEFKNDDSDSENQEVKNQIKANIRSIQHLEQGGYSDDRIQTVLYALDNAKNIENHDEYMYMRGPNGSDCANFVSQCLDQGFTQTDDWYYWGDINDSRGGGFVALAKESFYYIFDKDERGNWIDKREIQGSKSWLNPGPLREYFLDGIHGEAVTTLLNEEDIINAAKEGLIKPGDIATMGSKTVSDSHAIIITDVDTTTGKVYYSAHSTERINRDLANAFTQDDPEHHIYIVKPNYSDGK